MNKIEKTLQVLKKIAWHPMEAEKLLFHSSIFRILIIAPALTGLALITLVTIKENIPLSISTEGFSLLLENFKLPIAIAGLSIPLAAVVAAQHRSMQTAKQIESQNSQNIFSNHLEHRNHFFKFIDENQEFENIKINKSKAYDALFNEAAKGNLTPKTDHIKELIEKSIRLSEAVINAFDDIPDNTILNSSEEIKNKSKELEKKAIELGFNCTVEKDNEKTWINDEIPRLIKFSITATEATIVLANFHKNYYENQETQKTDQTKKSEEATKAINRTSNAAITYKRFSDIANQLDKGRKGNNLDPDFIKSELRDTFKNFMEQQENKDLSHTELNKILTKNLKEREVALLLDFEKKSGDIRFVRDLLTVKNKDAPDTK